MTDSIKISSPIQPQAGLTISSPTGPPAPVISKTFPKVEMTESIGSDSPIVPVPSVAYLADEKMAEIQHDVLNGLENASTPIDLRLAVTHLLETLRNEMNELAAENLSLRNENLRLSKLVHQMCEKNSSAGVNSMYELRDTQTNEWSELQHKGPYILSGTKARDAFSKIWLENRTLRNSLAAEKRENVSLRRRTSVAGTGESIVSGPNEIIAHPPVLDICTCSTLIQTILDCLDPTLRQHENEEWFNKLAQLEADRDRLSIRVGQLVDRLATVETTIRKDPFLCSAFHIAETNLSPNDILNQMHDANAQLAIAQSINSELERRLDIEKATNRRWQPNLRAIQSNAREYFQALHQYLLRCHEQLTPSSCQLADAFKIAMNRTTISTLGTPQVESGAADVLRLAKRRIDSDTARIEVLIKRIASLEEELVVNRVKRFATLEHLVDALGTNNLPKQLNWIAQKVYSEEYQKHIELNRDFYKQPNDVRIKRSIRTTELLEDHLLAQIFEKKLLNKIQTYNEPDKLPHSKVEEHDSRSTKHISFPRTPDNLYLDESRGLYRKVQLLEKKAKGLSLPVISSTLKQTASEKNISNVEEYFEISSISATSTTSEISISSEPEYQTKMKKIIAKTSFKHMKQPTVEKATRDDDLMHIEHKIPSDMEPTSPLPRQKFIESLIEEEVKLKDILTQEREKLKLEKKAKRKELTEKDEQRQQKKLWEKERKELYEEDKEREENLLVEKKKERERQEKLKRKQEMLEKEKQEEEKKALEKEISRKKDEKRMQELKKEKEREERKEKEEKEREEKEREEKEREERQKKKKKEEKEKEKKKQKEKEEEQKEREEREREQKEREEKEREEKEREKRQKKKENEEKEKEKKKPKEKEEEKKERAEKEREEKEKEEKEREERQKERVEKEEKEERERKEEREKEEKKRKKEKEEQEKEELKLKKQKEEELQKMQSEVTGSPRKLFGAPFPSTSTTEELHWRPAIKEETSGIKKHLEETKKSFEEKQFVSFSSDLPSTQNGLPDLSPSKETLLNKVEQKLQKSAPIDLEMEEKIAKMEKKIAMEWENEKLREERKKLKKEKKSETTKIIYSTINISGIGNISLDPNLLTELPFITQVYAAIIMQYGTLSEAFKKWTKAKGLLKDQFITLNEFGEGITSLNLPTQWSFKDISELYNLICKPIKSRLYIGSFYRNMEELKEITLQDTYRRLVEIFGNPPNAALEAINAVATTSIDIDTFRKLASFVGVTGPDVTRLWSLINPSNLPALFAENIIKMLSGEMAIADGEADETQRRSFIGTLSWAVDTSKSSVLAPRDPEVASCLLTLAEYSTKKMKELQEESSDDDSNDLLENGGLGTPIDDLTHPGLLLFSEAHAGTHTGGREKGEKTDIELLKEVEVLNELSVEELEGLLTDMCTEHFDCGEAIMYEGDIPDKFYVVKRGMAAAVKACGVVRQYKTAEFFGEYSLVQNTPRSAEVIALSDLVVFSLEKKAFNKRLGKLFDQFIQRAAVAYESPEEIARRTAEAQLATPSLPPLSSSQLEVMATDHAESSKANNSMAGNDSTPKRVDANLPPVKQGSNDSMNDTAGEKVPKTSKKKKKAVSAIDSPHKKKTKTKKKSDKTEEVSESEVSETSSASPSPSDTVSIKKEGFTVARCSPNAERLRITIHNVGGNLAETFKKMSPNAQGVVDFDSFSTVVSDLLSDRPLSNTEMQDLYNEISRPVKDHVILSSFYRNVEGSTAKPMDVYRRLQEVYGPDGLLGWKEYGVPTLASDVTKKSFKLLTASVGITLTDSERIWSKITDPSRDVVKLEHLNQYLRGDITATELNAKEIASRSVVGQLAGIFGISAAPIPMESHQLIPNLASFGTLDDSGLTEYLQKTAEQIAAEMREIDMHITDDFEDTIVVQRECHRHFPEEVASLKDVFSFRHPWSCLHSEQLSYLVSLMQRHVYGSGDYLFREGEPQPALLVFMSGELDLLQKGLFGLDSVIETVTPGKMINEDELLGYSHLVDPDDNVIVKPVEERIYTTSGVAKGLMDCVVWSLKLTDYEQFIKPIISERQRKIPYISKALRLVPLIQELNDVDLTRLAEAVKVETFRPGATVSKQNRPGDKFCIIISGTAKSLLDAGRDEQGQPKVSKNLGTLKPAEYFGELALIKNQLRGASIIAETNLKLLTLNREAFDDILTPSGITQGMVARAEKMYKPSNTGPTSVRKEKRMSTAMFFPSKSKQPVRPNASHFDLSHDEQTTSDGKPVPGWTFAADPTIIHQPASLSSKPGRSNLKSSDAPSKPPRNVIFNQSTLLPEKEK